jgi:arabinogalactan endo-1,4-beta-galactosidase
MRLKTLVSICLFALASCSKSGSDSTVTPIPTPTPTSSIIYKGADLSFLAEIEQAGITFTDSGTTKPALTIFKNNGCNLVRVRLWYNPSTAHSGLSEVLNFCSRIKAAGMNIFLDFHYSDTWADPSNQTMPTAWSALSFSVLQDSVYQYTKRVIIALQNQNTMPTIVQVGNEINTGILWNLGKLSSWTDPNLSNFATLLNKGIAAIKSVDANNTISIMLHYAGPNTAAGFFNLMQQQNVQYDIIGLSYYPWWHGYDLSAIQTSLNNLATTFNKKIMIAETAYPWTLGWNDYTNNIVGLSSQLISGYDATQQGQLDYLKKLKTMLEAVPNNLGIGFCYWEPDWVAFKGTTATNGSTYENLTLFDFQNKTTLGMQAYK